MAAPVRKEAVVLSVGLNLVLALAATGVSVAYWLNQPGIHGRPLLEYIPLLLGLCVGPLWICGSIGSYPFMAALLDRRDGRLLIVPTALMFFLGSAWVWFVFLMTVMG